MKTPDEIKKELERCTTYICGFPYCEGCLYGIDAEKVESDCVDALLKDALAYIQQLEAAQQKWIMCASRKMIWLIWIVRSGGLAHRQEARISAIWSKRFAPLSFHQQTIYPCWTSYHPFGAVLMLWQREPLKVEHLLLIRSNIIHCPALQR